MQNRFYYFFHGQSSVKYDVDNRILSDSARGPYISGQAQERRGGFVRERQGGVQGCILRGVVRGCRDGVGIHDAQIFEIVPQIWGADRVVYLAALSHQIGDAWHYQQVHGKGALGNKC